MERHVHEAWKDPALVRKYLTGIRAAIPLAAEQIDVMLRLIEADGREVRSFLDLGAGAGTLSLAILERWPGARPTLVDYSDPMLEEARSALGDGADIVKADLADPVWLALVRGSAPFDAVVSGYAIHHLEDARKRALYSEVFELLAPGAFFVNIEHVSSSPWLAARFDDLLVDSFYEYDQAIGGGRTREQVATEYVHREDKHSNILASVEDQCGWLGEIGFADVDCYFKLFELTVFGGRRPS
jgi:trans-aconitate methyltransferase